MPQTPERKIVCASDDLPDGTMRRATVGRRALLFVRRGETIYALRDVCPHQGAPLSAGILSCARKAGEVGQHEADDPHLIVRCPWHNWEIDVAQGTTGHDPQQQCVATYAAGIRNGQVYVEC